MSDARSILMAVCLACVMAVGACTQTEPQLAQVLARVPASTDVVFVGGPTLGDDGMLYFTEFDRRGDAFGGPNDGIGGALWKLDPSTGVATKFSDRNASGFTVLDGYAYFVDPQGSTAAVGRVSTSGGAPELYESFNPPVGLHVDDDWVYWTEHGTGGGMLRAPRVGGTTERLLADDNISGGLWLADGHVYWLALGGVIQRMATAGGAPESILECGINQSVNLKFAGEFVYVTTGDHDSGTLSRMRPDGSDLTVLLDDQPNIGGGTVDATYIYWVRGNDNRGAEQGSVEVLRMPLGGGAPEVLASKQNGVGSIVVTDTDIYWINSLGGTLMHISKDKLKPVTP